MAKIMLIASRFAWLPGLNETPESILILFCFGSDSSWNTAVITGENMADSLESFCVL